MKIVIRQLRLYEHVIIRVDDGREGRLLDTYPTFCAALTAVAEWAKLHYAGVEPLVIECEPLTERVAVEIRKAQIEEDAACAEETVRARRARLIAMEDFWIPERGPTRGERKAALIRELIVVLLANNFEVYGDGTVTARAADAIEKALGELLGSR